MNARGKIVVGLDGSDRATDVLASAVALATALHEELILVRAFTTPLDLPAEAFTLPPQKVLEILEARAQASLEFRMKDLPKDLPARSIVRTGPPWQVICGVAREEDATLIVIGSHGHSWFERVLGTTAERVVDHADRSVLVVREVRESANKKESSHV